ncbi:MAG: hypothetical protein JWO06_3854 [Bacteroidota bacterium]|nr:hypothetical protein [Bacteroidota bacterium]
MLTAIPATSAINFWRKFLVQTMNQSIGLSPVLTFEVFAKAIIFVLPELPQCFDSFKIGFYARMVHSNSNIRKR